MGLSAVFLTQFSDAVNNAEVAKSVTHVVTPNEYTSLSLLNDVFFHLCLLYRLLCTSILRLQLMYVWRIGELSHGETGEQRPVFQDHSCQRDN